MALKWRRARFLFSELQRPIGLDGQRDDELVDFDGRFRIILRKHLTVLCWWSVFCTVVALFSLAFIHGFWYYFFMMSMVWGVINFAIVIGVFNHTFFRKFRRGDSFERFDTQRHVQQIMFLNIGIDTAYIFVGMLLREHGFGCNVQYPDLWHGFGWAVIVQGIFLLSQDIVFSLLHHKNFKKAQPFLEELLRGK